MEEPDGVLFRKLSNEKTYRIMPGKEPVFVKKTGTWFIKGKLTIIR